MRRRVEAVAAERGVDAACAALGRLLPLEVVHDGVEQDREGPREIGVHLRGNSLSCLTINQGILS